ncbi:NAD(P)/FAD-dependent oxidoreductase [Kaistia terrae]|uniref:NAD(P)/FAD-dependent oxidoreductase n=1 Tax=Kaistia terrae TaxID=537017 RepID=A0ABW0PRB1_9HYPH|nr:FAD-dependent oxidoreductase [Kaistia terrae]MCX5578420.1 FAD-dependent oxidoreductase [Kaistia terrae]
MAASKVIVVGAGIAGLSLARSLVKQGFAVELFDQGPIPNPLSSSFDEHRITRHTYGSLDGYTRLMPDAFRAYDALWQDLGKRHYLPTGIAYVRRQADDWYATTARDLDAFGIEHRLLTEGEVAARLPMVRPGGIHSVVEVGGAGLLFPQRILADLVAWLREAGVVLHEHSAVEAIDLEHGRVVVAGKTHAADVVLVAAGAWVTRLLPEVAPAVTPSRQTVLYLDPPDDLRSAWAEAPILIEEGAHLSYTLPPRGGTGLKIGDHHFSRRGHPDEDRTPSSEDIAPVEAAAAAAFAGFERYRILEAKTCFYTVSDDESFFVQPLGRTGWVVSACSGHGFKLAPLIAQGVAEAISGKRDPAKIAEWAAGKDPR